MVRREPEEIGVVTFPSLGVWALLRHPDDFANAWSMVNIFRLPSAGCTLQRSSDHSGHLRRLGSVVGAVAVPFSPTFVGFQARSRSYSEGSVARVQNQFPDVAETG